MFLCSFCLCVCVCVWEGHGHGGVCGVTGDIPTFSSLLRLLGGINFSVGDINFFGNLKP